MSNPAADAEFTARYGECAGSLRRFVAARFHSELQDDVVSEAWYQAWLHYGSFRGECAFRSWLFSIASARGLNILRGRRRYQHKLINSATLPGYLADDAARVSSPSHEDRVIAKIDVRRIFGGVRAEDMRIVRMLSEGFTSEELGRLTRTTAGAIRQRRFRVLAAARAKFTSW
jgi:RNA polymerase sigma factor (sigma-70 family)